MIVSYLNEDVAKLVDRNGKNAAAMTAMLKNIGNGDMQNGINASARFCFKSGYKSGYDKGHKDGLIIGSTVTLVTTLTICGGIYLIDIYKRNKDKNGLENLN